MESPSATVKAIDEAKQKAREIVKASQPNALFQIVSNQFKGSELQLISSSEALELIENLEVTHLTRSTDQIWNKQLKTTASNPSTQKIFYWISDFQRSQIKPISNSDFSLHCVPILHEKLANIYIDTAYIHSPVMKINQDVKIIWKAKKSKDDHSSKSLVTISQNNAVKSRKEIAWGDKTEVIDTFSMKILSSDWQYLKLSISDPSVSFDNDFYFSFYIPSKPFVTMIGSEGEQKYLVNALKADDNYDVHLFENESIPTDELKNTNLIVLNQLQSLPKVETINLWLQSNKNILILPPSSISTTYNNTMNSIGAQSISPLNNSPVRIKTFNLQDLLLKDIFSQIDKLSDLPSFQSFYNLGGYSKRAKEVLISYDNSSPFLCKYSRIGEGNLYVFTAPIQSSQSDFVFSSVFAPLLFKLGTMATSFQVNSHFISDRSLITIPVESNSPENIYKIANEKQTYIPPQRKVGNALTFSLDEAIHEAGYYNLLDSKGEKKFQLALNLMREESLMDFCSSSDLKNILQYDKLNIDSGNSNYLQAMKSFSDFNLWKLWVWLAIIFIVLELIILAFWDTYFSQKWS